MPIVNRAVARSACFVVAAMLTVPCAFSRVQPIRELDGKPVVEDELALVASNSDSRNAVYRRLLEVPLDLLQHELELVLRNRSSPVTTEAILLADFLLNCGSGSLLDRRRRFDLSIRRAADSWDETTVANAFLIAEQNGYAGLVTRALRLKPAGNSHLSRVASAYLLLMAGRQTWSLRHQER